MSRRTSRLALSLLTAGTLGAALLQGPAIATALAPVLGGDDDPTTCTTAELKRLKAAGDNFADACLLPGQELAGLAGADLAAATQVDKSDDMSLVANVPLSGTFAEEGAYGTDIAFRGRYAYQGNYRGFAVYDIKNPDAPQLVTQVVCPGGQGDVSVYRTSSSSASTRAAATTPVPAPRSRPRRSPRGRACGSSTSAGPPSRGTSPRSRPRAGRTRTRSPRRGGARPCSPTCRRTDRARTSRTASRPTTSSAW